LGTARIAQFAKNGALSPGDVQRTPRQAGGRLGILATPFPMSEVLDSLHPSLRELPGKTIVERYRVDEALGVGGMGAVFRGRHLGLKRDVAIKVLHPDLTRDPEISKRFDREAHSASRLDHPNCLRVTDVGTTEDGVKFMVMDLLSGTELADRLGQPIAADRAVLMTLQILRGLEHAHDNGVVHRDVKPENIFITRDHDGREVLKLVDFGIAKLAGGGGGGNDTRMTKAGLIFGTPAYMSPEQAMGLEADARADLYAVGVILYEMLTGSPPFESDDPVKLVRMQVSRDPPPLPDTVHPTLVAVVMKLLAKDRDERFQSAAEVSELLEYLLPSIATSDMINDATLHGRRATGPIMMSHPGTGPISLIGGHPATGPIPMIGGHPATGPIPMIGGYSSTGQFPMLPPSGSSVSAPIAVPSSASQPISVSMPTPPELGSGMFSPAALPTLPPGSSALQPRGRSRMLVYGGVGAIALGLVVWAAAAAGGSDGEGGETSSGGSPAAVLGQGEDPAKGAAPGVGADEGGELLVEDGPDEARLAEVDRMILADKLGEAQALLQPLLDEYPANAMLAWRQGRIFAKSKKTGAKTKALAAYGDAVDAEPSLIDDHDFYAELLALLRNPKVRTEALNFALRKMGAAGHKFLLELVNDERNPLSYNDRRRALQELATVEENAPLINLQLHGALDLLQATQALTPCTAYRDALESIAAGPDYWYYVRVERAPMPTPKTGKNLTDEEKADAVQCEGLDLRRAEVLAELGKLAPIEVSETTGDEEIVLDDESAPVDGEATPAATATAPKKSSSGSKSSGGSSGGNKALCKIGFRKQCR
jgi:serine/threonine protein kinase